MPIEAVIFDMEGVLMDSEGYWKIARESFARDIKKSWSAEDQHATMGRNTVEWAQIMRERLTLDWELDDVISDVIRRVLAQYDEKLPLRAGALDAVRRMSAHYNVALASGSPTSVIDYAMKRSGMDVYFETRIYGDTIANGKPAPDIYLAAMEQLGVSPQRAVGIEDSTNGIKALHNAGMIVIAAPSEGFELAADVLALADHKVEHMDEITVDLIEKLGPK